MPRYYEVWRTLTESTRGGPRAPLPRSRAPSFASSATLAAIAVCLGTGMVTNVVLISLRFRSNLLCHDTFSPTEAATQPSPSPAMGFYGGFSSKHWPRPLSYLVYCLLRLGVVPVDGVLDLVLQVLPVLRRLLVLRCYSLSQPAFFAQFFTGG